MDEHCLHCDCPLTDLQIVLCSNFCSDECEAAWTDRARSNADYDALMWGISGPPDTASYESERYW